jgi:hypothetical protein
MYIKDTGCKMITVGKLKELLATLPDNYYIHSNTVGNLLIGNESFDWVGYIDFMEEGIDLSDSD